MAAQRVEVLVELQTFCRQRPTPRYDCKKHRIHLEFSFSPTSASRRIAAVEASTRRIEIPRTGGETPFFAAGGQHPATTSKHCFPVHRREPPRSGGGSDYTTHPNSLIFAAGGKNPALIFKAPFPSKHWCFPVYRREPPRRAEAITRRFEIPRAGIPCRYAVISLHFDWVLKPLFSEILPPEANMAWTFNMPGPHPLRCVLRLVKPL
ncbi:hypothetical protein C8R43DRAFT_1202955 [Mycena crocata]|nr:hypothetical protein C8R43DRAFT_1202955 [Mycena crocata]